MKKLSFEDGHIVLRNLDGTLAWSRHWVDMKGSYIGDKDGGGYIEVLLEGKIFQKSDFHQEEMEAVI
jgi:hypothetical protein